MLCLQLVKSMKALVIADRNPHLNIPEFVKEQVVDLVITLGDLTREDILGLESTRNIPKIGVYGNHDSGQYMDELGIINLHLKTWQLDDLTFGGFEGCVRYKDNPDAIMYTQDEANSLMSNFPYVDVFICHCPPYGINDEPDEVAHQGFHALRNYIDAQHPRVLLHGHTYPADSNLATQHGSTRIEYVFGYRVIEL